MTSPLPPLGFVAVTGFPFYCVSEHGVVMSCRTRGGRLVPWTPMGQKLSSQDSRGRMTVGFRIGRKGTSLRQVHRLVLEHFVGPCPPGMEGCHNDGNPLNNHVTNLRWDTHIANMADRKRHGRGPEGVRNPSAKLTEDEVREIRRLLSTGMFQKDVAPMFGVSKQCVQCIHARDTWPNLC